MRQACFGKCSLDNFLFIFHLGLQVAPEEEIAGVQVRGSGWPVPSPDRTPADHPDAEEAVQVVHVRVGTVAGGTILEEDHQFITSPAVSSRSDGFSKIALDLPYLIFCCCKTFALLIAEK